MLKKRSLGWPKVRNNLIQLLIFSSVKPIRKTKRIRYEGRNTKVSKLESHSERKKTREEVVIF